MESILTSIKAMLGIEANYTQFDNELILLINGSISKLIQIGVGPDNGFKITSAAETWSQLFGSDKNMDMAKNYIYLDVRVLFDPPSNSFVVDAFNKEKDELATRLAWQWDVNHPREEEVTEDD